MHEPSDRIFSISQINEYVRMVLDSNPMLHHVWLRGEISNFTNHYQSGHFYFTLKDDSASLRAVMFRGNNIRLRFTPENGMKVLAHGEIRSYPRDGQTQIVVDDLQPDGAGALTLAFEQLRRRLEAEGLFAAERKKPLVSYPKRIGIVTSPTGAAIHDIIRVAKRRYPLAELILFPAQVQGEQAALSLRTGVEFFNSVALVDEIIIGRGGGSMEDLWAFNDEALARSIAASKLPVISAVGHEVDYTICDFVADYRAPTPSAAAEVAVPDVVELQHKLSAAQARIQTRVQQQLTVMRQSLDRRAAHRLLHSPRVILEDRGMQLLMSEERLRHCAQAAMQQKRTAFAVRLSRLESLSPLAVLKRGYAMVSDENDQICATAGALRIGSTVQIQFADGRAIATVEQVQCQMAQGKES